MLRNPIAAAPLILAVLTACGPKSPSKSGIKPVLLFTGAGTSRNDVTAVETMLDGSGLAYTTINSSQLNRLTESQISRYRLLIVPGGNFVEMGNSLTASATANVRNAVNGGLSYLGICAGGFMAGHFPAPYKSFNLSSGVRFRFYSAEAAGVRKAAVRITTAEGPALDQYWEDGPQFTGWGQVAGKYPDGAPAVVEGPVGDGWMILSGVHPEAPASWRRGIAFNTPVSADNAYAQKLILAALNKATLAHF